MSDEQAPITRDDLADSIRSVRGEVEDQAKESASRLIPVAVGAGVLMLLIAYLVGRRVGTTKSTVVEIRRI